MSVPSITVTSAENVAAGPFVQPGPNGNPSAPPAPPIPAHCRVKLGLKPSSDSRINGDMAALRGVERQVDGGNAGFGGSSSVNGYGDMQVGLRRGYATAGNDTGHTEADGPEGMFGLGHPEMIVDFSHRAMHEMTVAAKRVIEGFYARAPRFS